MSEEKNNRSWLLIVASIVTILAITVFSLLAFEKDLFSLQLNEIGDTLAGFAGSLAFLWIIVTVLLQSTELKLQRQEVTGLKGASEDQAKSLKSSLKIQTLTLMRDQKSEVAPMLLDNRERISIIIAEFIKNNVGIPHAYEFKRKPEQVIKWLLGFFLAENTPSSIKIENITTRDLKTNIKYEDFLVLQDILSLMSTSWDTCKPLFNNAQEAGYIEEFDAWISALEISWYRSYYENIHKFYSEMMKVVIEHKIAPEFPALILAGMIKEEREGRKVFNSVPFSNKHLN